MTEDINLNEHYDLIRLRKYLNYEISSGILYILSFQTWIFIFLSAAAAIIFTPFMINILYKENKKNWIIAFLVITIIPSVLLIIIGLLVEFGKPLILISLALFYFYFFLLRFKVNGWLREINMLNRSLIEKNKIDEELKIFTNQFDKKLS